MASRFDKCLATAGTRCEMCPDQSQTPKKAKNSQASPYEEKKNKKIYFLIEPVGGTPSDVGTMFLQFEELTCVCSILS